MTSKLKWVPILGIVGISQKNEINYAPAEPDALLNLPGSNTAVIKSNRWFDSGQISFKVTIQNDSVIPSKIGAQIILNHGSARELYIGIGAGGTFGIQAFENGKLTNLGLSGGPNLSAGTYEVMVKVIGSYIHLYINEVAVVSVIATIVKCQPAVYIRGEYPITISDIKVDSATSKAFVIMQFTEEYNELYKEVIKPTVENYDIECIRADDIYTSGPILQDITQSIIESAIIIADITPDNPNVFYEVGYAHAIKKPVILLSDNQRNNKLPFDVSGFRVILYENSIGGKTKVENRLKKHIKKVLGY